MMKFEQALEAMREGEVISRSEWVDDGELRYFKIEDGYIIGRCCDEDGWYDCELLSYDLMHNDWILYDEDKLQKKDVENEI